MGTSLLLIRAGSSRSRGNNTPAITPASFSDLVLWVDASEETGVADGTAMASLTDLSGSGNDPAQGTMANQPTYETSVSPNGKAAYHFNGTSHQMVIPATFNDADSLPFTLFAVVFNATSFRGLFDSRPGGANVFRFVDDDVEFWNFSPRFPVTPDLGGSVIEVVGSLSGSNRSALVLVNGVEVDDQTGNTDPVVFNGARIGSINSGEQWFNGDIAMLSVHKQALSSEDRAGLRAALGTKFGITVA